MCPEPSCEPGVPRGAPGHVIMSHGVGSGGCSSDVGLPLLRAPFTPGPRPSGEVCPAQAGPGRTITPPVLGISVDAGRDHGGSFGGHVSVPGPGSASSSPLVSLLLPTDSPRSTPAPWIWRPPVTCRCVPITFVLFDWQVCGPLKPELEVCCADHAGLAAPGLLVWVSPRNR